MAAACPYLKPESTYIVSLALRVSNHYCRLLGLTTVHRNAQRLQGFVGSRAQCSLVIQSVLGHLRERRVEGWLEGGREFLVEGSPELAKSLDLLWVVA